MEHLYSDENMNGLIIMFRILRDYLILKAFCCRSDLRIQFVLFGLVNNIMDSDSDKSYVTEQLPTWKNLNIPISSSDVVKYSENF